MTDEAKRCPQSDALVVADCAGNPRVRVEYDGHRVTVTWLGDADPSLLSVRTPAGALLPEHGRPFLDALQRRLEHRPGWSCERTGGA